MQIWLVLLILILDKKFIKIIFNNYYVSNNYLLFVLFMLKYKGQALKLIRQ